MSASRPPEVLTPGVVLVLGILLMVAAVESRLGLGLAGLLLKDTIETVLRSLPPALAVVNPNRQDESGDLAHLCAAAVVLTA